MAKHQHAQHTALQNHLRRAGGVLILLFLMAGQGGQEMVQASFLLLGGACLALAEWWPGLRKQPAVMIDPRL